MIGAGHLFTEVRGYTLGQIFVFHRLAVRRSDEEVANLMNAVRLAAWADDKNFKDVLKGLRDG